ncbi:Uncharacterised protein [Mycobacteroides abscessus subsp. abscessus]|nr:Uncharacterised protein [Mycobacteroides abscessus subsp. abscessus]
MPSSACTQLVDTSTGLIGLDGTGGGAVVVAALLLVVFGSFGGSIPCVCVVVPSPCTAMYPTYPRPTMTSTPASIAKAMMIPRCDRALGSRHGSENCTCAARLGGQAGSCARA